MVTEARKHQESNRKKNKISSPQHKLSDHKEMEAETVKFFSDIFLLQGYILIRHTGEIVAELGMTRIEVGSLA